MKFPLADIAFLIITLALLIIVGVFDIKAAALIESKIGDDASLSTAHKFAIAGSITAIVGAAILIAIIIFYMVKGSKEEFASSNFIFAMLIIALIFVLTSGVFSCIVAARIKGAKVSMPELNQAYNDCLISALLGILGFAVITVLIIIARVHKSRVEADKKKVEKITAGLSGEELKTLVKTVPKVDPTK